MAHHVVAVVDEDRRFLGRMRDLLGGAGYTVRPFHGPKSAYALLDGPPPGAVIVGIPFPNCHPAIDLATALKLHRTTRAVPLILTSADAQRLRHYEQCLSGRREQTAWMLPRPIELAAVLQILAQTLDQLEREAP